MLTKYNDGYNIPTKLSEASRLCCNEAESFGASGECVYCKEEAFQHQRKASMCLVKEEG